MRSQSKDAKPRMYLKMHSGEKKDIHQCLAAGEKPKGRKVSRTNTRGHLYVFCPPSAGEDPWYFLIKSLNLACPNANSAGFLELLLVVLSTMATC